MKTLNTSKIKLIAISFASAALLAVLPGCVSKSYDKGAATSSALQSSADAVAGTSARVNDVLAALNNLTFKSQGDLRDQYDAFVSAAKKLDKANENLDAKVVQMRAAAAAFKDNWSSQMTNIQSADLRQRSNERMNEVATRLKDVDASYEGVKNSFKPFTSDVKDIQTYLGTDLTASGLNAIKDVVSNTKTAAVPLRDSIKKLQSSFSDLSAALSPIMPAPDSK